MSNPLQNMKVAAIYAEWILFIYQGSGGRSELMGRWAERDAGQSWKESCRFCKRLETGPEINLPAGQQPQTNNQSCHRMV